jgi:uncharacterized protein YlxP (DUF503 family)
MVVGTIQLEIFIPGSNSLKAKRRVVKSITQRLRGRFNVSVAEVNANDLWQRATLGIALANGNRTQAREILRRVLDTVERDANLQVLDCQISVE